MDIQLKHRLIGAIVILALLVIFVPMLFSKHAREKIAAIHGIPKAPETPQIVQKMESSDVANQEQNVEQVSAHPAPTQISAPSASEVAQPATQAPPMQVVKSAEPAPQVAQSAPEAPQPTQTAQSEIMPPTAHFAPTTPPVAKSTTVPESTPPVAVQVSPPDHAKPQMQVSEVKPYHNAEADNLLKQTESVAQPVTTDNFDQAQPKQTAVVDESNDFLKVTGASLSETTAPLHVRAGSATSENVTKPTHKQRKHIAIAKTKNKAWVVQLGSFTNHLNAEHLVQTLRQKGFAAFGYKQKQHGKIATRVFVGPSVTKNNAKQLQQKIQTAMHMKSIVIPFNATRLH